MGHRLPIDSMIALACCDMNAGSTPVVWPMKSSVTRRPRARSWSGWWRRGLWRPMASKRDGPILLAPRFTKASGDRQITSVRQGSTRFNMNKWSCNSPGIMGESRGEMRRNCAGSARIKPAGYSGSYLLNQGCGEPARDVPRPTNLINRAEIAQRDSESRRAIVSRSSRFLRTAALLEMSYRRWPSSPITCSN